MCKALKELYTDDLYFKDLIFKDNSFLKLIEKYPELNEYGEAMAHSFDEYGNKF
jgi:hypothetical protein